MTRDYTVIVPLMIANLASLFISSRLQKQPIYEALAHQDGIHLPLAGHRGELGQHRVFEVMRNAGDLLPADMGITEAVQRVRSDQFRSYLVGDEGSLVGVLSGAKLEAALTENGVEKKVRELVDSLEFPHVHADQALHIALERMSEDRLDLLPVVSRADVHKLEGIVTLRDVLDSYGVNSSGSA
jgi:chloride channel protein, CIC family